MSIPDDSGFWCVAPNALPGPKWLFAGTVYIRGAATLQALRSRIGDPIFFKLLYTWATDHRYGNGTSAGFEALAERVTGYDLSSTFTTWLVHAAQARVGRRSLFVTAPPLRFGIVSTAGINRSLLDAAACDRGGRGGRGVEPGRRPGGRLRPRAWDPRRSMPGTPA